jgi:hypothetical protein
MEGNLPLHRVAINALEEKLMIAFKFAKRA